MAEVKLDFIKEIVPHGEDFVDAFFFVEYDGYRCLVSDEKGVAAVLSRLCKIEFETAHHLWQLAQKETGIYKTELDKLGMPKDVDLVIAERCAEWYKEALARAIEMALSARREWDFVRVIVPDEG